MEEGKIFVISAPSGSGKTTLLKEVMKELPGLYFSVSYTSRPPRPGEIDGVDYHFISREAFREMIQDGSLLEWTEAYGYHYGTSKKALIEKIKKGVNILLDLDTKGAKRLKELFPEGVTIFILPPSMEDLRKRLENRGSDPSGEVNLRYAKAEDEMKAMPFFDYCFVNDDLKEAKEKLKSIILDECLQRRKEERLWRE